MLVSMTGFGQNEVSNKDFRVSVEIRTVNHRFLDFAIKLPKALNSREREIKGIINKRISRGRISITISIGAEVPEYQVKINLLLMEQYLKTLRQFARKHRLEDNLDVNTLAMLPDVFMKLERESVSQAQWKLVKRGVEKALDACLSMRIAEGKALEKDIRKRLRTAEMLVKKTERLAPAALEANRKSFRSRLEQIMEGARVDHDRWMTEVSMLADRLDFTEEIIRLKSHLSQFEKCLNEGGAVSKKLTYILQEIHREVTTVGSKASNAGIIQNIVQLKEESEKLREQVQNLE